MMHLIKRSNTMKKTLSLLILLFLSQACLASHNHYIGVLTPMPSESKPWLNALSNKKTIFVDGIKFVKGNYHHKNIILATTGIGKINATAISTLLVTHFHPSFVLLTGVGGKLNKYLKKGTVIIGQKLISVEHETIGNLDPSDDINPNTGANNQYILYANKTLLAKAKSINKKTLTFKPIFGTIATTDIYPPTKFDTKRAMIGAPDAIDMEGFAVASVCKLFKIPCLVIRGISDNTLMSLNKRYKQKSYYINNAPKIIAEQNAVDFALHLISKGSQS